MINLAKASVVEATDELAVRMKNLVSYNTILYLFNGKHYEPLDQQTIGQAIYNMYLDLSPENYTPARAKSIADTLPYHPRVNRVTEMDNYDNYINLRNGVLDLNTRELIKHSPDFMFTACTNVDYDPDAITHPTFSKFMETLFTDNDGNPDRDTINNIYQLGGYLIYPKIKMEKMFIFYGTGSNGKSFLMDHVFKKFFDRKFITSLSLNAISDETDTAREQLLWSRVNFATEQKANDIESDELKKVITGEDISIYRKYLSVINHEPKCKLVVAGNRFMRFKDTSEGTRRRLMIFNFKNRFEIDPIKYKAIDSPHKHRVFMAGIKDEMIKGINNELPAILNTFLNGLDILRANNWRFVESALNREVFDEYLNESDYLGSWLVETFERDNGGNMKVQDVMEMYRDWWSYNFPEKKFDISSKLMGRRIRDLFLVEPRRLNINLNGKMSTTSVYSIKIKDEDQDLWNMAFNDNPISKQDKLGQNTML